MPKFHAGSREVHTSRLARPYLERRLDMFEPDFTVRRNQSQGRQNDPPSYRGRFGH